MPQTIASIFYERATACANEPIMRFKEGRGPYKDMNWADLSRMVNEMSFGLASLGLEPKNAAAILSPTSHMWVAADMAIISNGAFSAPLYPTCSNSDAEHILNNSEAAYLFVANETLLKKVLSLRENLKHLKKIILMQAPSRGRSLSDLNLSDEERQLVMGVEELQELGRQLKIEKPLLIEERVANIAEDDLATVIYTSGTTGTPKGAMITHANITSLLHDLTFVIPVGVRDTYLSYLPLSHVFERICGEFYTLHSGGVCAFAEGIEHMAKNMAEVQPSMLLVVPRVLDRIYNKVKSGIEGASGRRRKLIEWSLQVGKEVLRHNADGKELRTGLRVKYWLAERLVFAKIRERIGKNIKCIVSGGAPATAEALEFFNAIGITTLEGYGLTETTAPLTVNRFGRVRIGTVGTALPSVEVKIAEDGEIIARGPSIFRGYFKSEEATKEVFKDGYFLTGDIGVMDEQGNLKITDRKKDLIVNSSGKNIAPQKIEAMLRTIPNVSQAIVFGDKRKTLVALLTMDEQGLTDFANEKGWDTSSFKELIKSAELRKFIKQEIAARSKNLADYEQVRNFAILDHDFSIDSGELTASMKVKRNFVRDRYKEKIEPLYNEHDEKPAVSSVQPHPVSVAP